MPPPDEPICCQAPKASPSYAWMVPHTCPSLAVAKRDRMPLGVRTTLGLLLNVGWPLPISDQLPKSPTGPGRATPYSLLSVPRAYTTMAPLAATIAAGCPMNPPWSPIDIQDP